MASCSQYQKLVGSTDSDLKWEKAQEYYEQKKYSKTIELLEGMSNMHKGTERGEKTLYLLASSYFNKKDFYTAFTDFETCYKTYPKGVYAEECRFYAGKSAYMNSPDPKLTQDETYKAIDLLNVFLDYYPESLFKSEVDQLLVNLRDKLVYKQVLNCRLYFNMGNFMGNNYQSCIVTANNALLDYPVSKYRQELSFLILKSRYTLALHSVDALKLDRYRATIDEYYAFMNEYPESTYKNEAAYYLRECKKIIKD